MADKVALTSILNERKIVLVAVKLSRYHDLGDAPRKSGEATPMERLLAIFILIEFRTQFVWNWKFISFAWNWKFVSSSNPKDKRRIMDNIYRKQYGKVHLSDKYFTRKRKNPLLVTKPDYFNPLHIAQMHHLQYAQCTSRTTDHKTMWQINFQIFLLRFPTKFWIFDQTVTWAVGSRHTDVS